MFHSNCRNLTARDERMALRVERAVLLKKLEQVWENFKELERRSLESSVCNVPSTSGSPVQTTTILRAVSESPSMALRLTSSTNSSPNTRHSPRLNLSPSTSPSMGTRRSSPVHIPSTSKSMHHSPHFSPSPNTASASKNTTHSPHTSLSPNTSSTSKNTQHNNPLISLNQNTINASKSMHNSPHTSLSLNTTSMSKNTNSSPHMKPNLKTNLQNNTNHSQTTVLNQVTNLTQITEQIQNYSNSPALNSNRNTCHNLTTVNPNHSTKHQSPSISPKHNIPTRRDPHLENSIPKLQDPHRHLENSPAQNKSLPHQGDHDQSPVRDPVQSSYLLSPHQLPNASSGKEVLNSLPDLQAELHLHPGNSQAQNFNSHKITHSHPTSRHHTELNLHLNPIQNSLEYTMTDNSQSTSQKHSHDLVVNPVQSHTSTLAHQAWSPSGNNLAPMCPFRDHHPLSLKPRRTVDRPPPLTLEDLATDSDSIESQSVELQVLR